MKSIIKNPNRHPLLIRRTYNQRTAGHHQPILYYTAPPNTNNNIFITGATITNAPFFNYFISFIISVIKFIETLQTEISHYKSLIY